MADEKVKAAEPAEVQKESVPPKEALKLYISRNRPWTKNSLVEFLGGIVIAGVLWNTETITTGDKKELIDWAYGAKIIVR